MDYTELDKTTQINAIKSRIRDMEQQHLQVSLRVEAPDLNQPPNEMDKTNVTSLEEGIQKLRQRLSGLETPPQPPNSQS